MLAIIVTREATPKAAFQFGLKMKDGRKGKGKALKDGNNGEVSGHVCFFNTNVKNSPFGIFSRIRTIQTEKLRKPKCGSSVSSNRSLNS